MKKLLLLCTMLLSIIGAYGITYPKVGVAYTIKNVYGFYHSAGAYQHYMMANSGGTQLTGTGSLTSENFEACQWVFEKADNADNAYYLKNYKTNKYVCVENPSNGQAVTLNATDKSPIYLFEGSSERVDGEYFISFTSKNVDDGGGSYGIHGNSGMSIWQGNGLGNQWVVEEVPPVYTIEGGTSSQHRGFLAAGEGFTAYPVLSDIAWSDHDEKSTAAISGGKYWYIHKINDDNTYVLFNLGLQKYLVLESDKINFGDYPYAWKIVQNTSDSNYKAVCLWNGTKQISFACGYTAAERNVRPNNQMGDGGSKHLLKCVLPADLTNFSVAINKVKNEVASLNNVSVPMTFNFVDNGLNSHSYTGAGGELYPLISGVENYSIYDPTWNGNTYNADIVFPLAVSSNYELQPTLIGQGSWSGADKKWTVVNGNVQVVNGTPQLAASQWLIFPTLSNNGQFTFKIQSVSSDKYVTAKADSGNDPEADNTPVTLTETGTGFQYIKTTCANDFGFAYQNNSGKTLFLTVNGTDDNEVKLGVYEKSDSHQGNAVRFPTFTEYNVTIGETGYTTVYSPFTAFTYSEDLEIYTITSAPQDGRVNLNLITSPQADDVSNYIYENQGVIIKGNPGTYTFNLFDDENYFDANAWTDNKLEGSFTNTYVKSNAYVLSAPDGVESIGLYRAELNKDENGNTGTTHFKNNAGKAYLPASKVTSNSRFFLFDFGGNETGIEEIENGSMETVKTAVYDLSGRRVQKAERGLFIVNGKKVVF